MFEQLKSDEIISTRGLKDDAKTYGGLIFDANSAYFYNHSGYEFAKQFLADAYKAAAEIAGGEQYRPKSKTYAMGVLLRMNKEIQQDMRLPIDRKMLLSIREAAEYSNIGINRIDKMLKQPNCLLCCSLVLKNL